VGDRLEAFGSRRVGIHVRVKLARKFAKRLLDLIG
jgi:hypothetical protein